MSILCRLGRHRPGARPRWNDGYYFTTCSRCGRDLVRTAFEGWKVPIGYRVVWSPKPPEHKVSARLAAEPASTRPASTAQPIYAVFPQEAQLEAETDAEADRVAPAPEAPVFAAQQEPATAARTEPDDVDTSITAVLRILRDEENRANEAGADLVASWEFPAAAVPPAEADLIVGGPEKDQPAAQSDPVAPDAAPMDPHESLGEHHLAPPPAPPRGDPAVGELVPDSTPGDDFMAEMDIPADETEFWTMPPAGESLLDEALGDPGAETAMRGGDENSAAEAPAEVLPRTDDDPTIAAATPEADDPALPGPLGTKAAPQPYSLTDDGFFDEPRPLPQGSRDERVSWPSAAPTQVHTPIVGMNEPVSRGGRNGQRSRMGVRIALAGLALAAALIVTGGFGLGTDQAATAPERDPVTLTAATTKAQYPAARAYVATRLLVCRASPARSSAALRNLARGEPVKVLAREPGWASIAHKGRQCWVADRYLSTERPL